MKRATVAAAMILMALAGCQDDEHFPPGEGTGPGGGGGGTGDRIDSGSRIDGGAPDGSIDLDGGISGELCEVVDLRSPLACLDPAPSGIEVAVVGSEDRDQTDAAGQFNLDTTFDPNLRLAIGDDDEITRKALVPARMWDGGSVRVPHVTQARWDSLMMALGGIEPDGTASIAVYLVRSGTETPVAGATVEVEGADPAYYDEGTANDWSIGGETSLFGAAIVRGVSAPGEVVITVSVGLQSVPETVPVEAGLLTWARIEIP
jgi:hypothetical protein